MKYNFLQSNSVIRGYYISDQATNIQFCGEIITSIALLNDMW